MIQLITREDGIFPFAVIKQEKVLNSFFNISCLYLWKKKKTMTNFHQTNILARTDFLHFCAQAGTSVPKHNHFVQCCSWTKTEFQSTH